jgi:hypothetical protein
MKMFHIINMNFEWILCTYDENKSSVIVSSVVAAFKLAGTVIQQNVCSGPNENTCVTVEKAVSLAAMTLGCMLQSYP